MRKFSLVSSKIGKQIRGLNLCRNREILIRTRHQVRSKENKTGMIKKEKKKQNIDLLYEKNWVWQIMQ